MRKLEVFLNYCPGPLSLLERLFKRETPKLLGIFRYQWNFFGAQRAFFNAQFPDQNWNAVHEWYPPFMPSIPVQGDTICLNRIQSIAKCPLDMDTDAGCSENAYTAAAFDVIIRGAITDGNTSTAGLLESCTEPGSAALEAERDKATSFAQRAGEVRRCRGAPCPTHR